MGWATMYNGAWDYPADTRGYTWGWIHEFHTRRWSLRYGSFAEPKTPNGGRVRSQTLPRPRRHVRRRSPIQPGEHPGVIRLLSFLNHTDSGSYAEAIQIANKTGAVPDVLATHRPGTLKYGFGVNLEQEITKNIGAFVRLGWNDGKTESFAFAIVDRSGEQRYFRDRHTVETAVRHCGNCTHGERHLRSACELFGSRGPGLHDR